MVNGVGGGSPSSRIVLIFVFLGNDFLFPGSFSISCGAFVITPLLHRYIPTFFDDDNDAIIIPHGVYIEHFQHPFEVQRLSW